MNAEQAIALKKILSDELITKEDVRTLNQPEIIEQLENLLLNARLRNGTFRQVCKVLNTLMPGRADYILNSSNSPRTMNEKLRDNNQEMSIRLPGGGVNGTGRR